jgi:hypothetical protein
MIKVHLENLTKGCLHFSKSSIHNQKFLYYNSIFSEGDWLRNVNVFNIDPNIE